MSDVLDVTVYTPDRRPVRFGDLIDRPTLVVIVRYYG